MKKCLKKCLLYIAIGLAILLFATACTNTGAGDEAKNSPQNETPPGDLTQAQDFAGQTLAISLCYDFYNLEKAIKQFNELYPEVTVVLNKYDNDAEKYKQQVTTQLMAGKADDLLDAAGGFSDVQLFDSGLLGDFYPLMLKDPAFNKDDYYMNVFEGMAYNGKLIVFPALFSYEMIGVNNTFSDELVKSFKQYETITYRQLFDIYNNLPEKGGRYFSRSMDAITALNANLHTFVDFENKKCYFNTPEFIQFISDAKNSTSPQKIADGEEGLLFNTPMPGLQQNRYAAQYLFAEEASNRFLTYFREKEQLAQLFSFLGNEVLDRFMSDFDKQALSYFIPLANSDGTLMLVPSKRFCLNANSKNKELAWEFIKFLTTPEANENELLYSFPVNKRVFRSHVSASITEAVDYWRNSGHAVEGETAEVVEAVMSIYEKYNELPMKYQVELYHSIIPDVLHSFHANILTAEQAASELQNKMSLFLME